MEKRSVVARSIIRPTLVGLAFAVVAFTGCEARRGSTVTVVDSAGVRIVTSTDSPTTYATIDTRPHLDIGGPDATGAEQFFQVQGILVDTRSRLWVADGQSGEVRIFDSEGRHLKTRGGSGDGPGEFRQIRLLGALPGDSVVFGDRAGDRITIFDGEGELARVEPLTRTQGQVALPHRVFEDGSVLAQVPRVFAYGAIEPGRIIADTARLVRIGPDQEVSSVAQVPGPLWLWTGRSQIPIPFTANPGLAVIGPSVHVASGPEFRIDRFQDGRLVERYGVARAPRSVRQSDVDGYREMADLYVDERQRPEFLSGLDHDARPAVLPAYTRLLVDDFGNVWAQRHSPDVVWDVFGSAHTLLGEVRAPESFHLLDIRGTMLAGVWRDESAVEHVRVYTLDREPPVP